MRKIPKILFIGDPLDKLKLSSDSSLALVQAALSLGHEVHWCRSENLSYCSPDIYATNLQNFTSVSSLGMKSTEILESKFFEYDFCFIRKDPPFDESYKDLCWLLSAQNKVKVINDPKVLLAFHEKCLHWLALEEDVLSSDEVIPTCLTQNKKILEHFFSKFSNHQQFIVKPWLGYGGQNITLLNDKTQVFDFMSLQHGLSLVQPFIENISTVGDRRVLIANGDVVGDFVRLPQAGSIASNLAQGGKAVLQSMTPSQVQLCDKIAKFLLQKNIQFAGLDLIGNKVGEINVTSPTGIRTYEELTGVNISLKIYSSLISK